MLLVKVGVLDLGVPLGKVQVKDGTKVIGTVLLRNDSGGELKIRLKRLLPGTHKLKVFTWAAPPPRPRSRSGSS